MSSSLPRIALLSAAIIAGIPSLTAAAELSVNLRNVPDRGRLVFQVYDSANAFGDFRDPSLEVVLPAGVESVYSVGDVAPGDIAVVVYVDENGNGILDKNFIGIPTETLGISNGYRPKGPPSFERASFAHRPDTPQTIDIELYRVLGERGRVGAGIGVIGRSSPYVGSSSEVAQVIPAVTYTGGRLQWLGPNVSYGLIGSGSLRLALTASYRVGAYEEDDSAALVGLGDRDGTLLAGLGLQSELPGGVEAELGYRHDLLDRIGGGTAVLELSKGFQLGLVRVQPRLAATWTSRQLTNHDFGVPPEARTSDRPAYELDAIWTWEAGFTSFFEVTESWLVFLDLSVEQLPGEVSRSPIVDDDSVTKGFAALAYVF